MWFNFVIIIFVVWYGCETESLTLPDSKYWYWCECVPSVAEEIKSRLRSGNACYHSVHRSSRLLSRSLKIKIYRTIILRVVLYGCETWLLTLWEGKEAEGV